MTAPRVFISSTYYDLKHLRSTLEAFVRGMGYEPILSEKGDIAYSPDVPLDESCYRAAKQADIFVLIVGGRYGSAASSEEQKRTKGFFERYDSITKKEYEAALAQGVPSYILVERAVHAEYQTFRRNREKKDVNYAHVDSVNIFHVVDEIFAQPRNNPVFEFDRYEEIESWLRLQWAGLFKDLLNRLSQQEQLSSLSSQVALLSESNKTLKRYLEEVVSTVSPDSSTTLIREESRRLAQTEIDQELLENGFVQFVMRGRNATLSQVKDAIARTKSLAKLREEITPLLDEGDAEWFSSAMDNKQDSYILEDINKARRLLNLTPLNRARKVRERSKSDAET